jgi:hypothetical protein
LNVAIISRLRNQRRAIRIVASLVAIQHR